MLLQSTATDKEIGVVKLTALNWQRWQQEVEAWLGEKKLLRYIKPAEARLHALLTGGPLPADPRAPDAPAPEATDEEKATVAALTSAAGGIDEYLARYYAAKRILLTTATDAVKAKLARTDLHPWNIWERYKSECSAKRAAGYQAFISEALDGTRLKPTEPAELFIVRFNEVLRNYEEAHQTELNDSQRCYRLLKGLESGGSHWHTFKLVQSQRAQAYESLCEAACLYELNVIGFGRQHEKENGATLAATEKSSSAASDDNCPPGITCFRCGKKGHKAQKCANYDKLFCDHCKIPGHTTDRCRKKKRSNDEKNNAAPSSDSSRGKNETESGWSVIDFDELANSTTNAATNWVLDSGATRHLTGNKHLLTEIKKINTPVKILTASGAVLSIEYEGNCEIDDGLGGTLLLVAVGYHSDIPVNLISIDKFCAKGAHVNFSSTCADIFFKERHLLHANRQSKVFTVPAALLGIEEMRLWHARFSHINEGAIKFMHDNSLVRGLDHLHGGSIKCAACARGKMTRAPFGNHLSRETAQRPFDRIHMDLSGAVEVESLTRARYFLVIVDEATDFVWTKSLRMKDDAITAIRYWLAMVATQFRATPKEMHSDGGGEFINTALNNFYVERGIVGTSVAPGTPQHNAIAERKIRTLKELTRSMLHHAQLPTRFWEDALNSLVYVHNLTIRSSAHSLPPSTALHGTIPSVKHIRVFGCDAYVKEADAHTTGTFFSKGVPCIFIGYAPDRMCWRFFNPVTRRILHSRDALFSEQQFSFGRGKALLDFYEDDRRAAVLAAPKLEHSAELQPAAPPASLAEPPPSVAVKANDDDNPPPTLPLAQPISPSPDERKNEDDFIAPDAAPAPSTSTSAHYRISGITETRGRKTHIRLQRIRANDSATLIALHAAEEPSNYSAAMGSADRDRWKAAMDKEMDSQRTLTTWTTVPRSSVPAHARILGSKWVYKVKRGAAGEALRWKARVVAKGFMQRFGIDYNETFAPVMSYKTLKILLAIAAFYDCEIFQFDVETAFLHATLTDEIYMDLPDGYGTPDHVAKLNKAIYGTKQAPFEWNSELNGFLLLIGFRRLHSDSCVYVFRTGRIILGIFVDDVIVICSRTSVTLWGEIKAKIFAKFPCKDMGEAKFILGIQITRVRDQRLIFLDQQAYITKILKRYDMLESKPTATPLSERLCDSDCPETPEAKKEMEAVPYRSVTGSLLYAAIGTRPDLMYAVHMLSQFNENPGQVHWNAAKHALKYLGGTTTLKLRLGGTEQFDCRVYTDADWAGEHKNHARSVSGVAVLLAGGLVDWTAKKQKTVAISSMESEYMAMAHGLQDLLGIQNLLHELGHPPLSSPQLLVDNRSAVDYAQHGNRRDRTRHISVIYHFVRERVEDKSVQLKWIPSGDQLADFFTKPLSPKRFQELRDVFLEIL